mmetsp:Transcript_1888/g.5160  ORF Transcript_1888/g.5160 Transcript_1888/m.5160 type:complete len:173 (+) Transcript_1888:863-1381(+)
MMMIKVVVVVVAAYYIWLLLTNRRCTGATGKRIDPGGHPCCYYCYYEKTIIPPESQKDKHAVFCSLTHTAMVCFAFLEKGRTIWIRDVIPVGLLLFDLLDQCVNQRAADLPRRETPSNWSARGICSVIDHHLPTRIKPREAASFSKHNQFERQSNESLWCYTTRLLVECCIH